MKLRVAILLIGVALLLSCSSNNSAPAVEQVQFDDAVVGSGGEAIAVISYRVGAVESSSKAFFSVVTIPPGASYVLGSSKAVFGGARPPNQLGACSDGRTYLSYNFVDGEFQDPFFEDEFIAPLEVHMIADRAADNQRVFAAASETPYSDPCAIVDAESAELNVDEDPATPTPIPED